jgi:hypothetical protein
MLAGEPITKPWTCLLISRGGSSSVTGTTSEEVVAEAERIMKTKPQLWLARTPPYLCEGVSEILPGLFVPDRTMPAWVREAIGPDLTRRACGELEV